MIHCCSWRELGPNNFQKSIQSQLSSPRMLQTLQSPFITRVSVWFSRDARVSLGFNLHSRCRSTRGGGSAASVLPAFQTEKYLGHRINLCGRKQTSRGNRDSVGFKLRCHTRAVVSHRKNSNGRKRRTYGGSLNSVLRAMESKGDIDEILNSWAGKLSPKEQTVILKEQSTWERVISVFRWMKSQKDYISNVIHYNVVLRALGRAQRWDELRLVWIEMARDSVLPTNNTYAMLVDVYGKAGLVKEALLWLRHMRLRGLFPDEVTMNTVVGVLKEAGEYDRAVRFFKNWCAGRIELNDLDLNNIADSVSVSDPISLKHFLSTELFRTGGRIPPSKLLSSADWEGSAQKPRLAATYNTLIDLYGKAGHLKDASNVFAEMLKAGVAPDVFTFNTMISTCGAHGHLLEAESLFCKMEERGIFPDTKTYNIFLSLYADAGNIDAALKCYKKIRSVGLFPDSVTHRAVIQILCERNMVQELNYVIEEMERNGVHIDEHSVPVIIRMYVNQGLIDRAKVLLEKCQLESGISTKTYAAIMDVYADKGLWAEAESIFLGKRDLLGQKKDVVEYNVMIKAYGKAKLYDRALSIFNNMRCSGTWPDDCTYNSLIQMLSGGDLVDEAHELLSEMQKAGFKPRCATFSAVIASDIRLGRLSDAMDVYQELGRAGVKPNEVIYGSLINGFAEAGKVEEALRYFHMMEESGIPANRIVYTSLIKAYGKVGCLEGAQELYQKMMDLEGGADIIASNSMINLYADLGMVSDAKLIFDSLRENGQADGVSFATMMYLYKSMGMLDEAIDIAQDMQLSGLLRDCASFNTVMASYVTNGQLRECGELLHQMVARRILPDITTFKVIFTVLKKGGFPLEAVMQLETSFREGKPFARQAVIASMFSVVGLHSFALEACETFTKSEVGLDFSAYNVAIYVYGAFGEVEKALNIFMKMQDRGIAPDLVTFINLVVCYGKAGMLEGVKRIHSQLKYGEIEPNESLFKAVIDAYRSANRQDLAELVGQEMKFAFDSQEYPASGSEDESDVCPIHLLEPSELMDTMEIK